MAEAVKAGPADTLVLLVTCSLDETRRDLAVAVMQNLASKLVDASLEDDFILFDNASLYKDHLPFAPAGALLVQSPVNAGYWSAINWVIRNARRLFSCDYKYIYIVESDLYHDDLTALSSCERFLERYTQASCVRTQEFSVRARWRFDKKLKYLPFRKTRSEINLVDYVSGEKAWFKESEVEGVYRSNLHAKLPALNRLDTMRPVFAALAQRDGFTEGDFFIEMGRCFPEIGVLDGGLFHSLFSKDDRAIMSGSYSSDAALAQSGYQKTRQASISALPDDLPVTRVQ